MAIKIYEVKPDKDGILNLTDKQKIEILDKAGTGKTRQDHISRISLGLQILRDNYNKQTVRDGNACSTCGNGQFIRTGTCHVCTTCGTSQGCS